MSIFALHMHLSANIRLLIKGLAGPSGDFSGDFKLEMSEGAVLSTIDSIRRSKEHYPSVTHIEDILSTGIPTHKKARAGMSQDLNEALLDLNQEFEANYE